MFQHRREYPLTDVLRRILASIVVAAAASARHATCLPPHGDRLHCGLSRYFARVSLPISPFICAGNACAASCSQPVTSLRLPHVPDSATPSGRTPAHHAKSMRVTARQPSGDTSRG
ncbi:MAG: hypothetical protein OJF49_002038 [Ktedonobacterales bacterium]|nr:MAG: hypothetical protein OJF49_002038 [Ktedonobacterales bacterium]